MPEISSAMKRTKASSARKSRDLQNSSSKLGWPRIPFAKARVVGMLAAALARGAAAHARQPDNFSSEILDRNLSTSTWRTREELSIGSSNSDLLDSAQAENSTFSYHKPLFPLDLYHDGLTVILAAAGLIIAASGGIGGGGMLVPLLMLVLRFKPKHAIALSNITIFGGAIANTALNARKRHPFFPDRQMIDWDLILVMEPLTIFGAVFGSLMSKILPNFALTVSLVLVLAFMGQRTLSKGISMWGKESKSIARERAIIAPDSSEGLQLAESPARVAVSSLSLPEQGCQGPYQAYSELDDGEACSPGSQVTRSISFKISALTACFVGICAFTVLKGGGHFSPFGYACGSKGYWSLYFSNVPWTLAFAAYFRCILVREHRMKVRSGHSFGPGEVAWDSHNTIKYPLICAISGVLAGLFGVGGGIVKGPLMLEMGIPPVVASASAAAMILYTSAAASLSYIVFGLLHPVYGAMFFCLGLVCTAIGQYTVGVWASGNKRQSPVVLSIGIVIVLSSVMVAVNTVASIAESPESFQETLRFHHVCGSTA